MADRPIGTAADDVAQLERLPHAGHGDVAGRAAGLERAVDVEADELGQIWASVRLAWVLAEHDPAATGGRGEGRQGGLGPDRDLARAGGAAELFDAVGVHG